MGSPMEDHTNKSFHIRVIDNVCADIPERWSSPSTVRRIVFIPELSSSSSPDFVWPAMEEIGTLQRTYRSTRPELSVFSDGLWKNLNSATWIHADAAVMQRRLCISAQTGPSGHCRQNATEQALRRAFFSKLLIQDNRVFV